jgi:SAM-dependent methyltransferase
MQARPTSFDRVADCYDATRALPPAALAGVAAGIAQAAHALAPAPALLEVGVGTGRIAVPLADIGVRVLGVDIAPAMLARLRAKRPDVPVVIGDAALPPFRPGTFHGVLFVHVLHLFSDPGAALRAAHALVLPRGMLLYGRTDHGASPRRQMITAARQLLRDLAGIHLGAREWNESANRAFAEHARTVGAQMAEATLAHWVERTTGRDLLEALARRTYSSSWAIPDAVMPELLQRLTPRVEDLLGGLDRVVETDASFTLVTARLPE